MEVRTINRLALGLAVALVVFGVVMRLLPHPDNLAPIGAIALFGGAVLPRKLGWWLPLAAMIISDYFIGFYSGIVFTWAAFLLVGLYGMSLRRRSNWFRIPVGALGSAVIFFLISNFGVWMQGNLYPLTWAGLVHCYEMALPFFRNTFFGDFLYGWILFGGYAFVLWLVRSRQEAVDAALHEGR
jgi:hypothetical protein